MITDSTAFNYKHSSKSPKRRNLDEKQVDKILISKLLPNGDPICVPFRSFRPSHLIQSG